MHAVLSQTSEMQRTATGREQACVKAEPVRAADEHFRSTNKKLAAGPQK
jgi:hypothetical protein